MKGQQCNWNSTTFCTTNIKPVYAMANPNGFEAKFSKGEVKIYMVSRKGNNRRYLCVTKESDRLLPPERYVVKACRENGQKAAAGKIEDVCDCKN